MQYTSNVFIQYTKKGPQIHNRLNLKTVKHFGIRQFRGPPGGFGEQGKREFISGEQRPNFQGSRGTMTIFGNRELKKTNFRFLENKPIYFRGTREQIPPGSPQFKHVF